MSRIQNILDKADRDGAIRRVRTVADSATVASATAVAPPSIDGQAPAFVVTPVNAAADSPAMAPAIADAPPARILKGARLNPHLIVASPAAGAAAEQYRALRTRIVHAENHAANVVLVTSPGRGDGKSLTAANLGLAMAQERQQRICVVDADLRSPEIHRLFGVAQGPGLADVLAGTATLEEALVTLEEHQITVLPAGTVASRSADLLGTPAMRRLIEALRTRFDRVVVDSPAAAPLADVGMLTPFVDSVVVIVRAGITPTPAIHDALSAIDPAKLLGLVLNEAA